MGGVFVEKAMSAASPDRDELMMAKCESIINDVSQFRYLFHLLDMDKTGTISLQEFTERMNNESMAAYMAAIGLELHDVELSFKVVAEDEDHVDVDHFVEGCMSI